jgi:hypothetical protein
VERIGDGRRAEQGDDLLLALAHGQLVRIALFDQVTLVDRLFVQNSAPGNGEGHGGDQQEITHREGHRVSTGKMTGR